MNLQERIRDINKITNQLFIDKGFSIPEMKKKPVYKPDPLDSIANNVANTENQLVSGQRYRRTLYKMRRLAGKILKGRTNHCGQNILTLDSHPIFTGNVNIMKGEGDKSHFSGLETCGSVWSCPICSLKILNYRQKEVSNIIDNVRGAGHNVYFATLTIPHKEFQRCKTLTDTITEAYRRVKQTRKYRDLKKEFRYIGEIKSLEVTYGKNGWHPHLHILFISDVNDKDMEYFLEQLFYIWQYQIDRMHFGKCNIQAFDYKKVYDGSQVSDYITKWGVTDELVNSANKQSTKGVTPFQILDNIVNDVYDDPTKWMKIYREYAKAFKGKRKLTYSLGIKNDYCDLEEITDQELTKETSGTIAGSIDKYVWFKIRDVEATAHVLTVFDNNGMEYLSLYLNIIGIKCFWDPETNHIAAIREKPPPE